MIEITVMTSRHTAAEADQEVPMRKLAAMLILLIYMAFYVWGVSSIVPMIASSPRVLQLLFYIFAGFIWIVPLRFLFRWMNANEKPNETL